MKTNLSGKLCLTLLAASCASMAVAASSPPTRHFQAASIRGPIQSTVHGLAVDRTPVTVVAILAGDSVANAQEKAGRRLTREEKGAIKAQRVREQSASWGSIESAGGHVIGTFQSALNGLKVSIPRNQVSLLRQAAGVVDVLPVRTYNLSNVVSVPRIQAPIAWSGADGVRGEGVKVAIIDTGIDYTHANFGGPGTVAAYQAALATDTLPADPTMFGPTAPKVKGGIDLVGDAYNANGTGDALVPHPDPNPLDCNSHGSHVAGTAAGLGVLSNGSTYQGPYDQTTDINNQFTIGPGVAPRADIYSIRVFGCAGSTNVVVDAIEWAVDNDMDVVNMSLGSDFGPGDTADAKAADDAVKGGVVIVSAAGNAGDILYSIGSPGSGVKGIAVAASAREAFDRTAILGLPALPVPGPAAMNITALNANNATWSSPETLSVVVLRNTDGTVSLGCDPAEYVHANVQGKIAVVQRGVCARVARAIFGQQAGAAAVVMINNAASLPQFEGEITVDPDNGLQFRVTIPFFGVKGLASTPGSDGFALVQRDGMAINLTEGTAIQTGMASFSSTGPRSPDSRLKPDITAPGTAIVSTGMGTGNQALIDSGTSMATPHITGTAALAIQAHPKWKPNAIKSAIINSGSPAGLSDYSARRAGSGFVNAAGVVGTQAIAFADADETTMNFQMAELSSDFSKTQTITVKNDGPTPVSFAVTVERKAGSPHTVTLGTSHITVGARSHGSVDVTLQVPVATAGNSDTFRDVAGLVTFTPTTSTSNHGYALRVPYYLVPRVTANVDAKLSLKNKATQGVVALTNQGSPIAATADFYAWGLQGQNNGLRQLDLHAAGVQSFPDGQGDAMVVFAINTFKGWSTPELQEFDVLIDVDGDGMADFDVFSIDIGRLIGPNFLATGEMVAVIENLKTKGLVVDFDAFAPTNSGTILLPVLASDIGVTTANPRFSYTVESFDEFSNDQDSFPTSAKFNAFSSAVSTGDFETVAPNAAIGVTVTVNPAELAVTPPLGFMIVSQDNKNGAQEVNLLSVKH
ncbi:MAG TPA: S8 family serine peptidase [Steroidobacteraceae bacterium]|nr:S8 family serine peptidase [Steroidobacteraceae bacterium]